MLLIVFVAIPNATAATTVYHRCRRRRRRRSSSDEQSMRDAIGDSDTVVNLIGKHYETKHVCFTRKEDGSLNRINSSFKNVSALACPAHRALAKDRTGRWGCAALRLLPPFSWLLQPARSLPSKDSSTRSARPSLVLLTLFCFLGEQPF